MVGKRQHVIPQFLQQGFVSRTARGQAYTWVFRQDTPPFESNVVNVGVEGGFYTDKGDSEADDRITAAESEFAPLVHALRARTASSLSDPKLPALISHLEVRTRHLRENFLRAGNFIVSGVLDFLLDEDSFVDWLIRKLNNNPAIMYQACARILKERQLPQHFTKPLTQLSMRLLPTFINGHKKEFRNLACALQTTLMKRLRKEVKSAHINALKQPIAPTMKTKILGDLNYAVSSLNRNSLILGDSIILFHVEGIRPYKTFLDKTDRLKAIYMPLDSDNVLVGASRNFTVLPDNLEEVLARCSLEYFIAADNSWKNQKLQASIGADACLLTDAEMRAIMEDALNN